MCADELALLQELQSLLGAPVLGIPYYLQSHSPGIAGAVGNNGIGIAGAAWNVKLMHIKVFQSTGQGTSTTIADGVEYASNNGANIINMSFGSYAESATLKLALEMAYSTSILVVSKCTL